MMIPLAFFVLPESIESLVARRPAGALAEVNRTLGRLGHAPASDLPSLPAETVKPSLAALFSPGFARITVLLTVAYFAQILFFYYIQKWIPKIVVDMRSEEHTSELQSLMRNSYAVFCLKKKKYNTQPDN